MDKKGIRPLLVALLLYGIGYVIYSNTRGCTDSTGQTVKTIMACLFMLLSCVLGVTVIMRIFKDALNKK